MASKENIQAADSGTVARRVELLSRHRYLIGPHAEQLGEQGSLAGTPPTQRGAAPDALGQIQQQQGGGQR